MEIPRDIATRSIPIGKRSKKLVLEHGNLGKRLRNIYRYS